MNTGACVHVELKMCTNCGQIPGPRSDCAFPNTLIYARTQRGVMCRAGLWKAAIWENASQSKQKPHKANACSTVQTPGRQASLLRREGRENRRRAIRWSHTRYGQREDGLDVMDKWGRGWVETEGNWKEGQTGEAKKKWPGTNITMKQERTSVWLHQELLEEPEAAPNNHNPTIHFSFRVQRLQRQVVEALQDWS